MPCPNLTKLQKTIRANEQITIWISFTAISYKNYLGFTCFFSYGEWVSQPGLSKARTLATQTKEYLHFLVLLIISSMEFQTQNIVLWWWGSHKAYWPFFPLEEKNLLNPRECFSGVGAEEEDKEPDLGDLCLGFFEFIGDFRMLGSASDGLNGALYTSISDSAPTLLRLAEVTLSNSAWSDSGKFMPLVVGSSSLRPSPFWLLSLYGDPMISDWGRKFFNFLPRRNMVSWHSASFSAAAANSFSCEEHKFKNSFVACVFLYSYSFVTWMMNFRMRTWFGLISFSQLFSFLTRLKKNRRHLIETY